MHKNHGVWIAIAAGVAIAGTSYAASAVLFGSSLTSPLPPKPVETATSEPSAQVPVPQLPGDGLETTPAEPSQPKAQPANPAPPAPKASEPTRTLTPVYAEQRTHLALAQAILRELPGYSCADIEPTDEEAVRYFYTFEDLNNDGNDEAIAYLVGSYTCGTGGCTAMIFDINGGEYTLNSQMTLMRTPIVVANTQTNGWQDLVIPVAGGGTAPSDRVVQWTGQSYAANPSMAPAWTGSALDGVALFADTITAETPAPTLTGEACVP
jgi:hypothetical protein